MTYKSANCTVSSHKHLANNAPCEDASFHRSENGIHTIVVCDGHGASYCFRSHIGAQFAVQACNEVLRSFAASSAAADLLNEDKQGSRVWQLAGNIVDRWRAMVKAHWEDNPFTEAELKDCGPFTPYYKRASLLSKKDPSLIPTAYGTTMLAALLVEDKYLLLLQQGDGECTVIDGDGIQSHPVPWDDRCYCSVTTSLCDADAAQAMRYHVIDLQKNPVAACMLTSDGVTQLAVLETYCAKALRHLASTDREPELGDASFPFGDRKRPDDVSMAVILDPQRVRGVSRQLKLQVRLRALKCERKFVRIACDKAEQAVQLPKRALDQAEARYRKACQEEAEAQALLEACRETLERLEVDCMEAADNRERELAKRNAARQCYNAALNCQSKQEHRLRRLDTQVKRSNMELQRLCYGTPANRGGEQA